MVKISAFGRRRTCKRGTLRSVGLAFSAAAAAANSGDSLTFARITRPTISRTKESRNGMRQPHERNCSWVRTADAVPSAKVPSAAPVGAPALVKEAANPRFLESECSSAMRAAPPHSPPTAIPWQMRSMIRITAPMLPIISALGTRPMHVDATPMMSMDNTSIFLRPRRSPKCPKIAPPSGLAK